MKVIEKILMVVVGLQERDYKIKYFDKNDNGVYRIDIKRHEDDFWQSEEYKECERTLGNSLIEGTYGSDTYTLWIKADEEQSQELEVSVNSAAEKYEKERPYNDYVSESIKMAFKAGVTWYRGLTRNNEECSHLPKPTQSLMNDAIKAYPDDKEKRAAYIKERTKNNFRIPTSTIEKWNKLKGKKEFNGTVSTIQSTELLKDKNLLDKIISLVIKVYDKNDADKFLQEIQDTPDVFITFMMIGDTVIGLGCISESHISFGVYELFWNMLDEPYRGNGWGKIFVEEGIKWIKRNRKGLNSPNDIIAVTAKPWHLKRCGFEVIKQLNNDEVLMHLKID